MSTVDEIWKRLAQSKEYREEFATSFLKRSVAFQIKTLRKARCGSQVVLAERSQLTQGVVSRAEDQNYGNLTFNTVGRIAGGLDMAFIGRFVPFSDLVRFSSELSEKEFASIPTFNEEADRRTSEIETVTMTSAAVSDALAAGAQPRVSQALPKHEWDAAPLGDIGIEAQLSLLPSIPLEGETENRKPFSAPTGGAESKNGFMLIRGGNREPFEVSKVAHRADRKFRKGFSKGFLKRELA
jgi:hypothetical protein